MFTVRSLHVSLEIWGCLFCLIIAVCISINRNYMWNSRKILMYTEYATSLLLGMDAMAWLFRGYAGTLGYVMVRISNYTVFLVSDVIVILFHMYLSKILSVKSEVRDSFVDKIIKIGYLPGIIAIVMNVINMFNNMYFYFDSANFYHRNTFHPLSLFLPMVTMTVDLIVLIRCRNILKRGFLIPMISYILLPFAASIVLLFFYGISLINIAITISMIFIFISDNIQHSIYEKEQQELMYQTKINTMIAQVGPHFIYNTLVTIRALCKKDTELAIETIDEFSHYLRGSLGSLQQQSMIPFEKELFQVDNYIKIQKKRFGDKINVEYNINETDFMIPALSVQTLVENAIKHGLCKKRGGGTITIGSDKKESSFVVTIADDGVGFDTTVEPDDGMPHIGIENVKARIKLLCKGDVVITSEVGKGTKAEIFIPDRSDNIENTRS